MSPKLRQAISGWSSPRASSEGCTSASPTSRTATRRRALPTHPQPHCASLRPGTCSRPVPNDISDRGSFAFAAAGKNPNSGSCRTRSAMSPAGSARRKSRSGSGRDSRAGAGAILSLMPARTPPPNSEAKQQSSQRVEITPGVAGQGRCRGPKDYFGLAATTCVALEFDYLV